MYDGAKEGIYSLMFGHSYGSQPTDQPTQASHSQPGQNSPQNQFGNAGNQHGNAGNQLGNAGNQFGNAQDPNPYTTQRSAFYSRG